MILLARGVAVALIVLLLAPMASTHLASGIPSSPPRGAATLHTDPSAVRSIDHAMSVNSTVQGVTWSNYTDPAVSPPGVSEPVMAMDPQTEEALLFGGVAVSPIGALTRFDNETWMMSPQGTWVGLAPSTAPSPRVGSVMEYVAPMKEFVLYGGANATVVYGDTWLFNLTTLDWSLAPPGIAPPPRTLAAAAPIQANAGFLIFGGQYCTGNSIVNATCTKSYYDDTWRYNAGSGWINETTLPIPPARAGASLTYVGTNTILPGDAFILTGGVGKGSILPSELSDTWVFSRLAGKWEDLNQTLPSPTPILGCGVYDPNAGDVFYIAGNNFTATGNTTWVWTYSRGWSLLPRAGATLPPHVTGAGCAWDPSMEGAVIFGGMGTFTNGGLIIVAQLDSTFVVRDVGWWFSLQTNPPLLAGVAFNLSAEAILPSGTVENLSVPLNLMDSTGTLLPRQISLLDGKGATVATVWTPLTPDVLSACQWGACANLTVSIESPPKEVKLLPPPTGLRAGAAWNLSLEVLDTQGSLVPWWNGTASIFLLPGTTVQTAVVVDGVGAVPERLDHAGSYAATALTNGLGGNTVNFTVAAGAFARLGVTVSNTSVRVGSRLNVTLFTTDAFGNWVNVTSVNVSDTSGAIHPQQVNISNGVGQVSLPVGDSTGTDRLRVEAEGVSNESAAFTVTSPPSTSSPPHVSSPWWDNPWLWGAAVAGAVIVLAVLFWYRTKKKKQTKVESKTEETRPNIPYLALLPFKPIDSDKDEK